ncbi:MAG: manganese-binding transcriptional regulator MntR [Planctomycetota bacterium]
MPQARTGGGRDVTQPHRRTRADHASETAEDYVEAIVELADDDGGCRVVDLAGHFGVSHVTVIRIVRRLADEGLVETRPYRPVHLTAAGRKLAKESAARHSLVFDFLRKLGVDAKTAAVDAEGIEHHLSPQTLRKMRAFLTD